MILPENLYIEEIRGLVRFGREFKGIKSNVAGWGPLESSSNI